jgi:hypothetical protein
MAIDDSIIGVWQDQGDLKEHVVFHADGTYRMVIPGVPALGTPDSTHAGGQFRTDFARKPAHLDLAVGGEWQFFIYEVRGDELRIDGAHDETASVASSRPTTLGPDARRFSRVQPQQGP